MTCILKVACVTIGIFVSDITYAAPINYDEATEGDLLHTHDTPQYLTLDIGKNVVSGTMKWAISGSDRDDIAFIIPGETYVTSIRYIANLDPIGTGTIKNVRYILYRDEWYPGVGDLGSEEITFPANRYNLFRSSLPLGEGKYLIYHRHWAGSLTAEQYREVNYTWEFELTRTPVIKELDNTEEQGAASSEASDLESEQNYFDGCEGKWEEIKKCAEKKKQANSNQ